VRDPNIGRAVAQAVSRWLPTAAARVRVRAACGGLWWTKRDWGRFSPNTSFSPANDSTSFSTIIIIRSWHNRPFFFNLCGGTLGTAATTGLLYQPQMIGDGDCGEIGGMNIGRRKRKLACLLTYLLTYVRS
jgi:hypothetical protein